MLHFMQDKYTQGRISDIQNKREYTTIAGMNDEMLNVDEHGKLQYMEKFQKRMKLSQRIKDFELSIKEVQKERL